MDVYLVVYSNESFQLSKKLFQSITAYIDDNYVSSHWITSSRAEDEIEWSLVSLVAIRLAPSATVNSRLGTAVDQVAETFSEHILIISRVPLVCKLNQFAIYTSVSSV